MQLNRKLAQITENATLGALGMVSLMTRRRTAVAIYTLYILTASTIAARCHASDETEGRHFAGSRLIGVEVRTICFVRALVPEEMDVTHFNLLDAVDFNLIVVPAWWVDALTSAVAGDNFLTVGGLVRGG
jgi:hypothetical protein